MNISGRKSRPEKETFEGQLFHFIKALYDHRER
jgi:hypothetical protein